MRIRLRGFQNTLWHSRNALHAIGETLEAQCMKRHIDPQRSLPDLV